MGVQGAQLHTHFLGNYYKLSEEKRILKILQQLTEMETKMYIAHPLLEASTASDLKFAKP